MSSQLPEKRPIIVFDMDGTLINEQGCIHPQDVALLTMPDPPAVFVPATGRSLFALRRTLQDTGISNGSPLTYPLILQNGSLIFASGEKKLRYTHFDLKTQNDLIAICKKKPGTTYLFFGESELRMLYPTPFGIEETERYLFLPREYSSDEPVIAYSKIMCLSNDVSYLDEMTSLVKGFDIEMALSTPTILEFNPPGVTKGSGLEMLVEYHNWDRNNIYCAGDAENDLGMFKLFENSFAPKTSPKSIQNRAANIIDTLEHGLLTPILQFATARR